MRQVTLWETEDGQTFPTAQECARHEFFVKWAPRIEPHCARSVCNEFLAEMLADLQAVAAHAPKFPVVPCDHRRAAPGATCPDCGDAAAPRVGPPTPRVCEHWKHYVGREGRYYCTSCEVEVDSSGRPVGLTA